MYCLPTNIIRILQAIIGCEKKHCYLIRIIINLKRLMASPLIATELLIIFRRGIHLLQLII